MCKTIWWILLVVVVTLTGCGNGPTPPEGDEGVTEPAPTAVTEVAVVPTEEPRMAAAREEMVAWQIEQRGVSEPQVLQAMRSVERHLFVPPDYRGQAYQDHPLPIGYGQTISQPYIVAWMTELLALEPDFKVLEIGTGSGYQAAILAELVDEVYTIEIVPELADSARELLRVLGYDHVHVLRADGYWGWEEHAPFDAIIVTAAPDHVPQPLVQQLVPGGRLVIPIGPAGGYQSLWQFTLEEDGLVGTEIAGVRFVPFVREGQ